MNKFTKMLGVTLLEVMLVLAVAAMVIVMSVRYYSTASAGQQANGMLSMIQAISAAADGLAQGTGSYLDGGVTTSAIQSLMPNESMTTPWGGTVTVANATANTYKVTFASVPRAVCLQVRSRLSASNKYTSIATCPASVGNWDYTYDAQK